MLARSRTRARSTAMRLIVLTLVGSTLPAAVAHADDPSVTADPRLSTRVDSSGTGAAVTAVQTPALRNAAARSTAAPRILLIGTGVHRALFPAPLQPSIVAPTPADGLDAHGYGTLAASVILQVLPQAVITSRAVPARDSAFSLIDNRRLAEALEHARASRGSYDAVLLAFPPQAALDPTAHALGHVQYGEAFGTGLSMVTEALLANAGRNTDGPVAGIPLDRDLRNRLFEGANLKQRDAIERYAAQAVAWLRITDALEALSDAGVAVIAPSGDLTRNNGGTIAPLPTQTIYGLSAHPDVITVGAAYGDGTTLRVSPTSGRGPTLDLIAKPDLLAPANVMGLLPGSSTLTWRDDSTRVPLARIDWAAAGVPPTVCPSITSAYRCVLQGSSVVSASVVTANLASLVSAGVPNRAAARDGSDGQILRGIAVVEASRAHAIASEGSRTAYQWEEGAGVLAGLGGFDRTRTPVPMARADLGTIGWNEQRDATIPLWAGGARAATAVAALTSHLGPDPTGRAIAQPYTNGSRVSASAVSDGIALTVGKARAAGGVYGGTLTLSGPTGDKVSIPLDLIQGVTIDFHVDYAYNEFQTGGIEGERVEKATAMLFVGLPPNVGLVGEAFKNLSSTQLKRVGGDPTNGPVVRYATTRDTFVEHWLPASEHGRGRIEAVPPGFYKIHIVTDHAVEARQARGEVESIGMQLASTGPDATTAPGANLLVTSRPACPITASGAGSGCVSRDGEIDPSTGLCVARNDQARIAYRYYCGEIAFAVPSAVVSRAVHHIEHDADPARSEWSVCDVPMPLDGSPLDFARIVDRADGCDEGASASSWTIGTKAPSCLGPGERAAFPNGHPTDVRATFRSLVPGGAPGSSLPAAVLTYEFALPYLNTYTSTGLAFSYSVDNAIVGVRFQTGNRATDDASHGLLVLDDPDVDVTPALQRSSSRGSIFETWELMSANASVAQLSLIIIPTAWTSTSMSPTAPIATVDLCDVSLRVSTFAKQAWGQPVIEQGRPTQFFPVLDRGLGDQIDPGTKRVRAIWDPREQRFADRGTEPEALHLAVQIPKDTTLDRSQPHHVRSPHGNPAYLTAARRWGTDARRHEGVLPAGFETFDPGYGLTSLRCSEGPAEIGAGNDPDTIAGWQTCRAWNEAREGNEVVGGLFGDIWANGRFAGILAVDHATIARAAGNVAFEIADADDGGAFEQRWATTSEGRYARAFPVPDFYDDRAGDLSLSLLGGAVSVRKNGNGQYVLTVGAGTPGGTSYTISTEL